MLPASAARGVPMSIHGYEIVHELSRNEWHALHRGRRRLDGMPVLLKAPSRDPVPAADVKLLEREYEILRDLAVPGVPRAWELLRHDGRCTLVLEDAGGTDELRRSGILARVLKPGDPAPEFALPNADGRLVSSRDLLARGPLVATFYRGKW